jgi:hypothetical protein
VTDHLVNPTLNSRERLMRMLGLLLLLAAVCPRLADAQTSDALQTGIQAAATLRLRAQGPVAPVGHPLNSDLLGARRFSSRAPGATLMIIGGSAIVAGVLVGCSGGTVLILGGVGVGAYGVYLYTR